MNDYDEFNLISEMMDDDRQRNFHCNTSPKDANYYHRRITYDKLVSETDTLITIIKYGELIEVPKSICRSVRRENSILVHYETFIKLPRVGKATLR